MATLLVQNGTLKQGDIIIAGTSVGRVRTMLDYRGNRLTEAGPSVPVEIAGLSEAPVAGAPFFAVADERMARELVEQRKAEERAKAAAPVQKVSLENLFDQIKSGERKELALIVKADVQGSVEAVKAISGEALQRRGQRPGHPRRCGCDQRVRCDAGRRVQRYHRGLQCPAGFRCP